MPFKVHFNDAGRTATQKADPKYPNGIDVDVSKPGQPSCCTNLPYPAPRCGSYSVVCETCHFTSIITVAGRVDDPRTLTVPCKTKR